MNKTIIEYNILRTIAVLLVLLGHSAYYNLITDYGGIIISVDKSLYSLAHKFICVLISCIYTFHMPLFFALSGALWSNTIDRKGLPEYTNLLKAKFNRLVVPMILCAILFSIPIKYISGYWLSHGWSLIKDIAVGQIVMFGNSNSHLWFLQALFLVFILSYLIEKKKLRKKTKLFWPTLLFLCLSCKLAEMYSIGVLNILTAFQYLFWFYIGFVFEKKRIDINLSINKIQSTQIIVLTLIYTLILFLICHYHSSTPLKLINYIICGFLGISFTYIISYKLSKSRFAKYKIITLICAASLGLYLYSDPLNYLIISLLVKLDAITMLYSNWGSILFFVFRFIATFILAYFISYIFNTVKKWKIRSSIIL